MSKSTHQIAVTGVDQTAKTFQSIQARAIATGRRISSIMGGAIAAAGAYLGVRSIKGAVDELGKLSDLAMKSGTSVEFLTKSVTAFQVAGLDVTADSLARTMQLLQKNTGKSGENAFYETLTSIAEIPDAAERSKAAIQAFGRSGLELLPIVNGGREAIDKMRQLTSIMPGVSDAAAKAGDDAKDAFTIFGNGIQSLMLRAVGKIAGWFGSEFPGGVRAGALNAVNWIEIFGKRAVATVKMIGQNLGALASYWVDVFRHGNEVSTKFILETWKLNGKLFRGEIGVGDLLKGQFGAFKELMSGYGDAFEKAQKEFDKNTDEISDEFSKRMTKLDAEREAYRKHLESLSIDDLAGALGGKGLKGGAQNAASPANVAEAVSRAVRVSNSLIMGGSNAERRLSVLGPTYQNEQKKQTEYLKTIAKNTEKTAENTDGGEDLQVLNP